MLTFAKLVGGLLMLGTSLAVTYLYLQSHQHIYWGMQLYCVNALVGIIVGWRSIGFDPGFGGFGSIVAGVRGMIVWIFAASIIFGLQVVIDLLFKFLIKDFWGLVDTWVDRSLGFGMSLLEPNVMITLALGSVIAGIGSGLANRFWT